MAIDITPSMLLGLWVVAGAVVLVVCFPMLLGLLGLSQFRSRITEDPAEARPPLGDAAGQAIFDRLEELGFEPIGTRLEQAWFFAFHWVKSFHIRMFGTPGGDCFASVYQLIPDEPWRITFSTGLEGGSLVTTGSTIEQLEIREEDYFRWGFATDDLGELLGHHREVVSRFAAEKERSVERQTLASLDELIGRHSQRQLQKDGRNLAKICLGMVLLSVGLPALLVGSLAGFEGPAVPLAVLATALAYPTLMFGFVRAGASKLREEDAAHQAH